MSGRVGVEQTPDIAAVAARLFLADPTRPGPGPWMSLHESGQLPYLSMAQAALDTLAPVLAAAVREARAAELREAADFISATSGIGKSSNDFGQGWYGALEYAIGELRDRADRIAVDAPEGGEGR